MSERDGMMRRSAPSRDHMVLSRGRYCQGQQGCLPAGRSVTPTSRSVSVVGNFHLLHALQLHYFCRPLVITTIVTKHYVRWCALGGEDVWWLCARVPDADLVQSMLAASLVWVYKGEECASLILFGFGSATLCMRRARVTRLSFVFPSPLPVLAHYLLFNFFS